MGAVDDRRRRTNAREARVNAFGLLWIAAIVAAAWAVTYGPLARWPW